MPAPIPPGTRYAGRTQVFTGSHGGTCGNCGRSWGDHNGIACEWQDVDLRCTLCNRRTGDHRQGQCEIGREQFTLPIEFVELWGEIGKAHAADICFQKYTPKTWPNKTLRKAKEAGLSTRTSDCDVRNPPQVFDEAYTVGREAFARLMRFGDTPLEPTRGSPRAFVYHNTPPTWSVDDDILF